MERSARGVSIGRPTPDDALARAGLPGAGFGACGLLLQPAVPPSASGPGYYPQYLALSVALVSCPSSGGDGCGRGWDVARGSPTPGGYERPVSSRRVLADALLVFLLCCWSSPQSSDPRQLPPTVDLME